ncbi:(3S,6E)-nerolidol synthase 1 [Spatholobus suberectus]|nr:(3S,6E)-nerolidol synthase 1 [Spatholobus suberectus]
MALHLKSCFHYFKPQTIATKAQLSQKFDHVKFDSLPTVNKWNILQENHSIAWINSDDLSNYHAKKLKVLKHVLGNASECSAQGIYMIDAMQRLNIDYHFQEEIDAFLQMQYMISSTNWGAYGNDLHQIALYFRLFRQQGYYVPAEVFGKFIDKEGKFNQKLGGNIKGMIDLYEASQLSIAGEDILDEAGQFSGLVLKEKMACLHDHEAKFVRKTLEHPFHKSLAIFTAQDFFGDFHGMNGWLGSLKEVAKLDFSLLQRLHQQEIIQISKWWTELGLANELKYARNQPLKWYIWSLACLTDPTLSEERVELTKPISFIYLLDDIFDVYGTLDELTLFTDVVSRWDISATEQLPDYMKICFKALYDLTNEISSKIYQKHGWDPTDSLRKTWKDLCKAFLVEAEWFASGNTPSAEEYLKNGIVSSGVHIVLVHIFFLLGQGLTKENVQIIDGHPRIISSSATILRLWDDLGNAEDENQEGHDGSYVNCLLREDQDFSFKRARGQVMGMLSDAWKSLNQECLFDSTFPTVFTKASLNLARMVPLMYSYDDKHSLPKLEEQVKSLLFDNSALRTQSIFQHGKCVLLLYKYNVIICTYISFKHQLHFQDVIYVKQALILKEAKHVCKKLISENPMESLHMIDIIQRLGTEHHFEEEIEAALQKQQLILSNHPSDFVNSHQLYEVALTFRLLRQGGHYVHADLFDSLKSNKGKFKEKYGEDVKGLIALYEASQLSVEEDSLDDVGYLSCQLLHAWLTRHKEHHGAIYVTNTLQDPLHYGLPRFRDRSTFPSDFKAKNEWITCLEELAEINSCLVRFMNQNEIIKVYKWWKGLEMANEVKFAKYQPLKWYMWPMACFTDPRFSEQRIELTKPISLIYVIDDIFDVYGTLDQLILFTDAVNRWELDGTEQLPDFMKMCLSVLYDITNDSAEKIYKKHGLNPIDSLKRSWLQLLNAFLEEAHWLNSGHLPRSEEYLNNGIVSTGVHVVLVHAFFLLDQSINKEIVAIIDNFPEIIHSVAKILRLSDDLEGAKSEDQNGLDGSYLDCYMKEHQDVSAEDAQRHVAHLISSEWKRLNREILNPNPLPSSFTNFCLNAARMVPLMYHYRSNPGLSTLQEHVKSLFNNACAGHM